MATQSVTKTKGNYPFASCSEEWYPDGEIDVFKDVPMTLISVVKETESALLIAADNLEYNPEGRFSITPKSKLNRVGSGALAWACAGNATVGGWFSGRLRANAPTSWFDVTDENGLRNAVAKLNGSERGSAQLARIPWKDDFGVTCVLAGWLNGEVGIWDIDTCGQPTPFLDHGILFEGGPVKEAHLIWDALEDSNKTPLEKLQSVYKVIGVRTRMIDEDPDIWRITSEGITVVQGRDNSG